MTIQAFYSNNGLIDFTMNTPLTDKGQLDSLEAKGLSNTLIPDGKDGSTGMIDVATGLYIDFQPSGPRPPDMLSQLVVALIKANSVSVDDFHPASLININAQLSKVNMPTVDVPIQIAAIPN